MSFFESYIILAIFGFLSQKIYQGQRTKGHKAFISYYSVLLVIGLLILDILIYLGLFDTVITYIYNGKFANGSEFMWNPFSLFGIDFNLLIQGTGTGWLAFLIFISYPCWYVYWKTISKYLFGIRSYSGGWWDVLKPLKKPKKQN